MFPKVWLAEKFLEKDISPDFFLGTYMLPLMFTRCFAHVKPREVPVKPTHPIMLIHEILEETL